MPIYSTIIRELNLDRENKIMKKETVKIQMSHIKTRITWGFNPIARVKPSKKIYSRKKYKRIFFGDI